MKKEIMIETSARHCHLSRADLDTLFGEGYELTNKKDLSQPGQFACEEKVVVSGPKGSLKMSILGPVRKATQVELSFTDARALGVTAPIRESGDIAGSTGVAIEGPKGKIEIAEGAIIAKRHIHFTPEEAAEYGVEDKQIVSVKYEGTGRAITFGDVVVRVSPKFAAAMHIDTDEANAGAIAGTVYGEIIK